MSPQRPGPKNVDRSYVEARVGRDVRIVRRSDHDVIGRLDSVRVEGEAVRVTISRSGGWSPAQIDVELDDVIALWVRG